MDDHETSRRTFLQAAAAGLGLGAVITVAPAHATPAAMEDAVRKVVGSSRVSKGRVKLELPPLSENGNTVPLTVSVERPDVVSFRFGPRAGLARVSTRIRLANTQTVTAIGELSDGSFWSASAAVVVTLAACLEDA